MNPARELYVHGEAHLFAHFRLLLASVCAHFQSIASGVDSSVKAPIHILFPALPQVRATHLAFGPRPLECHELLLHLVWPPTRESEAPLKTLDQ